MDANELWRSPGEAMKPRDIDAAIMNGGLDPGHGGHLVDVLYGVGCRYSEAFYNIGVATVGQLAGIMDIEGLDELTGIPGGTLRRIRQRALSYLRREIYQVEPFEFPIGKHMFIDIETDTACRRVWLIGLLVDGELTQLYADSWGEEKRILEDFLGFLIRYRGYSLVSYSGTGFDYRVTLNAARRYSLDTRVLEGFPHIDLCTLLRRYFVFPHRGYGLKGLGSCLGYGFRHVELNGLAVALEYQRHIESGTPLDVRVLEYNEDDVLVIQHLVDKCFSIRRFSNDFRTRNVRVDRNWAYIETMLDHWLR